MGGGARFVSTPEVVGVVGAVVVVDVIRAFSTAAHAFSAGARAIYLVAGSTTAVEGAGPGPPTYVITGRFADPRPPTPPATVKGSAAPTPAGFDRPGSDDLATADHVDPTDIELATAVDRFGFAMEVSRDADGLRLDRIDP